MGDDALITVRPNTEFRLESYRYAPKAAASSSESVLAVMKGGLRIVTGLMGKVNREGYAVNTPTATIGSAAPIMRRYS